MKRVVIGLDTSCYTTSAAAVTLEGEVLVSSRRLLPVPEGQRGLRQSEMVFIHTKQLPERVQEVGEQIRGCEIAAVCASRWPASCCMPGSRDVSATWNGVRIASPRCPPDGPVHP